LSCSQKLTRVLEVALPVRDVLEERVDSATPPAWCLRRGWAPFLLSLDEATLGSCEARGLAALLPGLRDAPTSLVELAKECDAVTQLPRLHHSTVLENEALRSVRLRKRAQLSALLGAVTAMAGQAERIVDVGAGSGHFTRLSAELFERDAVGLERSAERVASANQLARSAGSLRAQFVTVDARGSLTFSARDLAIGLHACGELGDHLIQSAAAARCDLALVSCCLQKISGPVRQPLSRLAAGTELRREHLGLTNLTAQPQGVEASIETTIAARQTRYALGQLLRGRGVVLEPGAEMSGINRRRANAGLAAVAERALALRQLAPATANELSQYEASAVRDYGVIRRLSLPRSMLARLLEVLVSLDRAQHLAEQGLSVQVATLFDRATSPRNIGIFASSNGERLPAA
jgi:SAM-dependent methyltransferase